MKDLKYVEFTQVVPDQFLDLLNGQRVREHLIQHDPFDAISVKPWMEDKIAMNSCEGCKVRVIFDENTLIGWCGIQLEDKKFEIAIVIDDRHWGVGITVFKEIMRWAKEIGHDTIYIHLLKTRPEYRFLRKISNKVFETEHFGRKFLTYQLSVS